MMGRTILLSVSIGILGRHMEQEVSYKDRVARARELILALRWIVSGCLTELQPTSISPM